MLGTSIRTKHRVAYSLAGMFVLPLCSSTLWAKPRQERHRYCVFSDGHWSLQAYPPLIDLHSKMLFEQVTYDGEMLETARLRSFDPDYELVLEYKFDAAGKMLVLHGLIRRWGRWAAEATLYPDANGVVTHPRIEYFASAGGSPRGDPDDGPEYAVLFNKVTVYKTIQDIPCAGLLKEAEKMNATQK